MENMTARRVYYLPTFLLLCDIGESVLIKLLVLPEICQAVAPLQLLHQAPASLDSVQVTK